MIKLISRTDTWSPKIKGPLSKIDSKGINVGKGSLYWDTLYRVAVKKKHGLILIILIFTDDKVLYYQVSLRGSFNRRLSSIGYEYH